MYNRYIQANHTGQVTIDLEEIINKISENPSHDVATFISELFSKTHGGWEKCVIAEEFLNMLDMCKGVMLEEEFAHNNKHFKDHYPHLYKYLIQSYPNLDPDE